MTKLVPGIDLTTFDCGEQHDNQWLSEHAYTAVESGSSMVYILLERMNPDLKERAVGYYAICPTMVTRDDIPRPVRRGTLRRAPAWLLVKLARDKSLRGDGVHKWGAQLLREALRTILDSADKAGGQVIVVDADNADRLSWYSRQGFKDTGSSDTRLYMKVATARKYLGPG